MNASDEPTFLFLDHHGEKFTRPLESMGVKPVKVASPARPNEGGEVDIRPMEVV